MGWTARGFTFGLLLALGVSGCSSAPPAAAPPSLSGTPAPTGSSAPAPGASGAAPRPAASAVVCGAATLSVALGPTEGAAGTVYAPLRFTNTGSRPCVVDGYPGVSYVTGERGNQVGRAALRDGARSGPVTLAPGQVAYATLAMVQVGNFDPGVCQQTPVHALRVYPPAERVPVFVPIDTTGCAGNPPGPQLRVSSIKPGAGPG